MLPCAPCLQIPDKEEMLARLHQLKERISGKQELILEKDTIIKELSGLLERSQEYAAANRDDAFKLARAVVDYKQRYRAATRKIMALVSELSMFQVGPLGSPSLQQIVCCIILPEFNVSKLLVSWFIQQPQQFAGAKCHKSHVLSVRFLRQPH